MRGGKPLALPPLKALSQTPLEHRRHGSADSPRYCSSKYQVEGW